MSRDRVVGQQHTHAGLLMVTRLFVVPVVVRFTEGRSHAADAKLPKRMRHELRERYANYTAAV